MNNRYQDIDEVRNKVMNVTLAIYASLGTITVILSFLRSMEYGNWSAFIIQSISVATLILLAIFSRRLGLNFKVYSLIMVIIVVLASGLYRWGFLASAKVLIAILAVIISFVLSYRKGLFTLLLLSFVYIIFAYLYSTGKITYSYDVIDYASNPETWMHDYVTIFLAAWGLLYAAFLYERALLDNYLRIENQNIELSDNEKKYRRLFESSNDAIILIDKNSFFDCNNKTFELFNCTRDYIIGKEPHIFSPEFQADGENSKEKADRIFSLVYKGDPQVFDWQHQRPNGEVFDVSISLNLIELNDNKYAQAVLRDITEKKQIEKELELHRNNLEKLVAERTIELETAMKRLKETQADLMQSEKMASLGVLTSGVAHEINNPLNFIMGAYEGLKMHYEEGGNYPKNEEVVELFHALKTGLDRTSNIVQGLNQFSRSTSSLEESCDIHTILDNCLLVLNNQLRHHVTLEKKYLAEESSFRGNSGKIHQVFLNILSNASQAIENQGHITIKTERSNRKLIVKIIDDGIGISKANLNKITDPFFTTKDPGKGTGLGLSIAYGIIQEHNGTIEFESEEGHGTKVSIFLPNPT